MHLASFLAVSTVLIIAPGPDMALVGRNALFGGRRMAVATAFGVGAGLVVWSFAASAGVAALLRSSEPAFLALRVIGAAYLFFLGVQALRAAWSRHGSEAPSDDGTTNTARPDARPRRAFRQGFLSNLGNPKIAIFFTSFLPQFTPSGASFFDLLPLGLAFCLMTLVWLAGYGVFVAKAGDVLRRPRTRRAIEGFTGVVLIGFGLRLATEHR
jgi:threonine/homoserine/homoserine lactone efflux protein